jgi:hypothetical protein
MNWNGFPVPYSEGKWVSRSELETMQFRFGYETAAAADWLEPGVIRGKGLTQAKSRIDQFAY